MDVAHSNVPVFALCTVTELSVAQANCYTAKPNCYTPRDHIYILVKARHALVAPMGPRSWLLPLGSTSRA
jgi:hypothetical protein